MDGWIKIYTAGEEYQAEVIKGLLENNGLHPVMLDRKDDEFRLGVVEVYVSPKESEKAKEIMASNSNEEE